MGERRIFGAVVALGMTVAVTSLCAPQPETPAASTDSVGHTPVAYAVLADENEGATVFRDEGPTGSIAMTNPTGWIEVVPASDEVILQYQQASLPLAGSSSATSWAWSVTPSIVEDERSQER